MAKVKQFIKEEYRKDFCTRLGCLGILMLCALTVCALFTLVACERQNIRAIPMMPVKAVQTEEQIEAMMISQLSIPFNAYIVGDESYAIPDEKWVKSDFLDLLRKFQASIRETRYIAEGNDCDDFAKMASAFSKLVYSNSRVQGGKSPAIGEFYYRKVGVGDHAINFAIVSSGDQFKIIFFDPQTWEVVKLSREELDSCFGLML